MGVVFTIVSFYLMWSCSASGGVGQGFVLGGAVSCRRSPTHPGKRRPTAHRRPRRSLRACAAARDSRSTRAPAGSCSRCRQRRSPPRRKWRDHHRATSAPPRAGCLFVTGITLALITGVPRPAGAQDAAANRGGRSTPRRSARCATPSPAKAARANPLDGVGAKLSADDIRQWIVDPVEMAKKANRPRSRRCRRSTASCRRPTSTRSSPTCRA